MPRTLLSTSVLSVVLLLCSAYSCPAGTIRFAAAADQHYGYINPPIPPLDGQTVDDWMTHPDLPDLDFVVASMGDWVSDHRDYYQGPFRNIDYTWEQLTLHNANRQKIPYFFVFGNHDVTSYDSIPKHPDPGRTEQLGRMIAGMNENNYAFMYNNVLFICAAQTNVMFWLSHFQRDWIEYLVGRYPTHTTVIWAHQATYETTGQGDSRASSWTDNDYRVHNDVTWWRDLFDTNPQIKLYIHGHNEKGVDTVAHNLHSESWDDHCTFVMVPSNGKPYEQDAWSYLFEIDDDSLEVRLWDCDSHSFESDIAAGVPYLRTGMNNHLTSDGLEWYSIPKRLLDGQNWTWKNRMLARNYQIELVGTDVTEQIDNPELNGCLELDEMGWQMRAYWYAVRNDDVALNLDTGEEDGFILVNGGNTLQLAASPNSTKTLEGNVPYNTATAVSGKTYVFSATIGTTGVPGLVDFLVSIPRYRDLSAWIWQDQSILLSAPVGMVPRTISREFTLPDNDSLWFIQPKLRFHNPDVTYVWHSWSLKMAAESDWTKNFSASLNGHTVSADQELPPRTYVNQTIPRSAIHHDLEFSCRIEGNRVGMLRFIYVDPQLWSDDVAMGVLNEAQDSVYLEDLSPWNDRTTIMSFNGSRVVIEDPDFRTEIVRGKRLFIHDGNDAVVNRVYPVLWKRLFSEGPGSGGT